MFSWFLVTLCFRCVLLHLVMALYGSISKATASWCTMLSWFLVTLCFRCVLLHLLLLYRASLNRPLITVLPGGVALHHLLALLHLLCPTIGHIILHLMNNLHSGTLRLIDSLAYLLPRNITVLH